MTLLRAALPCRTGILSRGTPHHGTYLPHVPAGRLDLLLRVPGWIHRLPATKAFSISAISTPFDLTQAARDQA